VHRVCGDRRRLVSLDHLKIYRVVRGLLGDGDPGSKENGRLCWREAVHHTLEHPCCCWVCSVVDGNGSWLEIGCRWVEGVVRACVSVSGVRVCESHVVRVNLRARVKVVRLRVVS
jgi:hypothetical protein